MTNNPITLSNKLSKFDDYWSPRVIAEMNDYQIKLAKFKGEFTWHSHKDTDELFYIVSGSMSIEFRNRTVHLNEGDLFIVPMGVEHKPFTEKECHVMLIEPAGVVNTGEAISDLRAENDVWV